jgi:hypothetical protein
VNAETLSRILEEFLAGARSAAVLEDGAAIFDLAHARYSLSSQHGKCILHLWSEERNIVRRVLDCEVAKGVLRLSTQRFGQSRPVKLEVVRERDRRKPSAKKNARAAYQQRLEQILRSNFSGWSPSRLTSAPDLERSLSPVYARGLLRQGNRAWAVMGVNAEETQGSIDASLTFAIIWLDLCRQDARSHVEGLKLFVPPGTSAVVRERMAHLNPLGAKFQLYELDEGAGELHELDTRDRGNIVTRLVHCPDQQAITHRFAQSITRVRQELHDVQVVPISSGELAFRVNGLDFARARLAPGRGFRLAEEIVFGIQPNEVVLTDETANLFADLTRRISHSRRPDGNSQDPLFRTQPERWIEAQMLRDISLLDERLDPAMAYSQVPAFAASDRAMIDVLSVTREGRLAVIELKADEDIHLPLQGIDYWARVVWHHARGEFHRFGYFPERELSPEPPLLLLVAPALHIHPATDTLLRYLAPEIDITLVGVDERWREGIRVVFRKRRSAAAAA